MRVGEFVGLSLRRAISSGAETSDGGERERVSRSFSERGDRRRERRSED